MPHDGHLFKNIRGRLTFDPARPQDSSVEVEIDARGLWTGEPDRDAHLRSADFLACAERIDPTTFDAVSPSSR
jgi:polyisoprenoid-binding protein YceI